MSLSAEQLRALLMQAPARVAVTRGRDHVYVFANELYLEFLDDKNIIGKRARDVFPVAAVQGIIEIADGVYATGEPYVGIEAPYLADFDRDGFLEERYFNVLMQPVRGAGGAVEGLMLFSLEVTAQVLARRQIQQQKRDFFAAAAHDLKAPLTTIKATTQLLRRRILRAESLDTALVVEGLERIEALTSRMASSIGELLDATSGQMDASVPLAPQRLDLVELMRQMADEHQHGTDRHQIQVHAAVLQAVGMWDRARLQRAFGNILSNAIKFSPRGGAITIELDVDRKPAHVAVVSIHDEGLGIPAGDLPRIFERGQRAANVAEIEGTGLGLTGALSAIHEHSGTISVSSIEGEGATFTIRLPMDVSGSPSPGQSARRLLPDA